MKKGKKIVRRRKIVSLVILFFIVVTAFVVFSRTKQVQIMRLTPGGNYYCNGCSNVYDKTFARWESTTLDCEGVVEGSQKYTPSCSCSAEGKPLYPGSTENMCGGASPYPYVCSGCTEYKKMGSEKVFAVWQSIYSDCSVKNGSVRYSKDKYCAGSTRVTAPVSTTPPSEGSVTIVANSTLNISEQLRLRFNPVTINKSNNQFSIRMRVPSYSYNFFANIHLYVYPLDPVSRVPREQAFLKLNGISDGQYHEYTLPFNTRFYPPVVEEIFIVFGNIPRVSCADRSRENPCYLPIDIDYIRL